jgi:3-oxoacid CoA-transferase B subunit
MFALPEPAALSDPAPRLDRKGIARRVARDLPSGAVVNLGIGIPSMCADFLTPGVELRYHAENGILGFRELYPPGDGDPNIMDAGGNFPRVVPGMAFFDSVESFNLIRGGHIDVTVLGGLQVSVAGDLANWMIPHRGIGSIGGAMDLAANAKMVIVAMEHTTRSNGPKIVDRCDFPLTAPRCVSEIVTDVAVIQITEGGLVLTEVAPGWTAEDVQAITQPHLTVSDSLSEIAF